MLVGHLVVPLLSQLVLNIISLKESVKTPRSLSLKSSFFLFLATVASQTAGTNSVDQLARQGKACLFIHGTGDQCLSAQCSQQLYRLAGEPKELVLYDNDNHGVTNHRSEAKEKIKEFALQYLCIPAK